MPLLPAPDPRAVPLHLVASDDLAGWLDGQDAATRTWAGAMGFAAKLGEVLCLPGPDGSLRMALAGWGTDAARRRGRFPLAAAAIRSRRAASTPSGQTSSAVAGVAAR